MSACISTYRSPFRKNIRLKICCICSICVRVFSLPLPTNGRGLWKTTTKETHTQHNTHTFTYACTLIQTDRQTIFIAFGCCSTVSLFLTRLRPVCTRHTVHNTYIIHDVGILPGSIERQQQQQQRWWRRRPEMRHSAFVCVKHSILFIPIYIHIERGLGVCEHEPKKTEIYGKKEEENNKNHF